MSPVEATGHLPAAAPMVLFETTPDPGQERFRMRLLSKGMFPPSRKSQSEPTTFLDVDTYYVLEIVDKQPFAPNPTYQTTIRLTPHRSDHRDNIHENWSKWILERRKIDYQRGGAIYYAPEEPTVLGAAVPALDPADTIEVTEVDIDYFKIRWKPQSLRQAEEGDPFTRRDIYPRVHIGFKLQFRTSDIQEHGGTTSPPFRLVCKTEPLNAAQQPIFEAAEFRYCLVVVMRLHGARRKETRIINNRSKSKSKVRKPPKRRSIPDLESDDDMIDTRALDPRLEAILQLPYTPLTYRADPNDDPVIRPVQLSLAAQQVINSTPRRRSTSVSLSAPVAHALGQSLSAVPSPQPSAPSSLTATVPVTPMESPNDPAFMAPHHAHMFNVGPPVSPSFPSSYSASGDWLPGGYEMPDDGFEMDRISGSIGISPMSRSILGTDVHVHVSDSSSAPQPTFTEFQPQTFDNMLDPHAYTVRHRSFDNQHLSTSLAQDYKRGSSTSISYQHVTPPRSHSAMSATPHSSISEVSAAFSQSTSFSTKTQKPHLADPGDYGKSFVEMRVLQRGTSDYKRRICKILRLPTEAIEDAMDTDDVLVEILRKQLAKKITGGRPVSRILYSPMEPSTTHGYSDNWVDEVDDSWMRSRLGQQQNYEIEVVDAEAPDSVEVVLFFDDTRRLG
ncbi:uncharacterized protein V1510DRAFT_406043 [Dipodascopsis tothii]|uniref:uncharacterized protein n=1 Tax=Dipodascopsis tothii TaxID=44089 RepID=UPI0034CF3143